MNNFGVLWGWGDLNPTDLKAYEACEDNLTPLHPYEARSASPDKEIRTPSACLEDRNATVKHHVGFTFLFRPNP